jgi:hypothetical protein
MSDLPAESNAGKATNPAGNSPQPPQVNSGPAVNPEPEGQSRKRSRYRKLHKAPIWIEAACAIALVGITGFYTHYAHQQVEQLIKQYPELHRSAQAAADGAGAAQSQLIKMEESNRINREALESVQRAFVVFAASPEVMVMPNFWDIDIAIDNAGNTPTRTLKDRVSWIFSLTDLPENYSFPDRTGKYGEPWAATGANVIGPKDHVMSQSILVDEASIKRFADQSPLPSPLLTPRAPSRTARGIVFYGWATYRDIFNDTPDHLTEFCRMLSAVVQGKTRWSYCPFHNCTDGDCPDYKERIEAARKVPICCPSKRAQIK